jgi:hypothetical protein
MTFTGNTTCNRRTRPVDRIGVVCALAIGIAGCGAKGPPLVNPGASAAPAFNASLSRETPDASPVWERIGEIASYRRLAKEPFPSQGHFDGRWTADVLANDLAAAAYLKLPAPAATFAEGSIVAQAHTDRLTGSPGPVFAMVKREAGYYAAGGDWEYVVTLTDGRIEDRGQLAHCARCHADAPAGWLFGLGRGAR